MDLSNRLRNTEIWRRVVDMREHALQRLREALGMSRAAFALSIGRSESLIRMIEHGFAKAGADTALRIVKRYGAAMEDEEILTEDLLAKKVRR